MPSYIEDLLVVDAEIRGLIHVALDAARRRPKPDDDVIVPLEKALDLATKTLERGTDNLEKEGTAIGDDLYAMFDGEIVTLNTYEPQPQTLRLTKETYGNLTEFVANQPPKLARSYEVGPLLWGFLWGVTVTLLSELALTLYYTTPRTW